jgi:adenosylcobinamide-phosphate synthase
MPWPESFLALFAPALSLLAGFLLDQVLGDPPRWPHPVRWIGRLIQLLEPVLRCLLPERLGGCVLLLVVTAAVGATVWAVLALAELLHPILQLGLAIVLTYYGLAARGLAQSAHSVLAACDKGDWPEARRRLAGIVGRDTQEMPPAEIYRACIETVAENTSDAVIAPLLYAALAGPVGLWVYKAINTLDSMVGYRNPRYQRFGWASARADDLANFVPARLTWLLMTLAALTTGHSAGKALRIGWRDGRKHPSPNAGWGEATMAGALGVRLGGPSTYQGVPSSKPVLGEAGTPPTLVKANQAIRVMLTTSWLALALAIAGAVGICKVRMLCAYPCPGDEEFLSYQPSACRKSSSPACRADSSVGARLPLAMRWPLIVWRIAQPNSPWTGTGDRAYCASLAKRTNQVRPLGERWSVPLRRISQSGAVRFMAFPSRLLLPELPAKAFTPMACLR